MIIKLVGTRIFTSYMTLCLSRVARHTPSTVEPYLTQSCDLDFNKFYWMGS